MSQYVIGCKIWCKKFYLNNKILKLESDFCFQERKGFNIIFIFKLPSLRGEIGWHYSWTWLKQLNAHTHSHWTPANLLSLNLLMFLVSVCLSIHKIIFSFMKGKQTLSHYNFLKNCSSLGTSPVVLDLIKFSATFLINHLLPT